MGATLFLAASWDKPQSPLTRQHLRIINVIVGLIGITFIFVVVFSPQLLTAIDQQLTVTIKGTVIPWHQTVAYILTLMAWMVAAWRLYRIWQATHKQLDGVMALIAVWLAIATVSQNQFDTWHLSWWIYHILLLNSAITAGFYLIREYEQVRQFSLTRYYAITSLVVMAGLALLTSFFYSQAVQREREDILTQQSLVLGQNVVANLNTDLPVEATADDLSELVMMSNPSLNQLLQGGLLSVEATAVTIYDTNFVPLFNEVAEGIDEEVAVENGRVQQALAGEATVSLSQSARRAAANIPFTQVQTYIPIENNSETLGVLVFTQEVSGLNEAVLQARRLGLLIAAISTGALFVALLGIVRRADRFITTRTNELAQAYADLQQAEATRDELTDMIVHDLRSPLTAVDMNLQLLTQLASDPSADETRTRYTVNARNSLKRTINLINDMLDVAKLEAGKLRLSTAPLDIKTLLADRAAFYAIQAEAGNKYIEVVAPDNLPQAQADENLMHRVLDNLISNALKYTHKGGQITLQAQNSNGAIHIKIADDGDGISADNLQRIFDKYIQVDNENGGARRGTGLGLTFCKLAVEAHGGRIWVESKEGQGSNFYFTLPLTEHDTKPVK
jgi:signal transduction histidine kinase